MEFNKKDAVWKTEEIRNLLVDDISRKIFDARVRYAVYRDDTAFVNSILELGNIYTVGNLDEICKENPGLHTLVIYGAGRDGRMTYSLIKNTQYRDYHIVFCDGKLFESGKWNGVEIISPAELLRSYRDSIVIISSRTYADEIYNSLLCNGFPVKNILIPVYKILSGFCGEQYFDFFEPREHEVFADVGALNAGTSRCFSRWCHGEYDKIYVFEANPLQIDICKNNIEAWNLMNCQLINKGAWSSSTVLNFDSNRAGAARITGDGDCSIEVDTIDHMVKGECVTFIKMDIEGSEYEALLGAKETIENWSPRLAISIYHKPEDIFEIPALIHQLDAGYQFAIRHYSSYMEETVLYAWKE